MFKIDADENLTKEELFNKIEKLLKERELSSSDLKSKNHMFHAENRFILGHFYFETVRFEATFELRD